MVGALVEMRGRERWEIVLLTQDMQALTLRSKKTWTDAKNSRKQNIVLEGEVRKRYARAMRESARLKAVTEALVSFKSKVASSRVVGTNSYWGAHNIANGGTKVEDVESKELMAVS